MLNVVFDFDGPIFDGRAAATRAIESTIMYFEPSFGQPNLSFSTLPLFGPKTLISMLYPDLAPEDRARIRDYYQQQLQKTERDLGVGEEVRDALNQLRSAGVRMAVFSSRSQNNLEPLLSDTGLGNYFIVPLGCGPKYRKPCGEYIRYLAAEQFHARADQIVSVGDSDWDYLAAKEAGVWYYHASWTGEPTAKAANCADLLLRSLSDFVGLVISHQDLSATNVEAEQELLESVRQHRFSFCAGAGISIASGIGGWEAHYRPIMTKLGAGFLEQDSDLPVVLQLLAADPMRASKVFDAFQESFEAQDVNANPYHFAMLRSEAERIWTSNYDNLFEQAITVGKFKRKTISNDADLLKNLGHGSLVIKVNGDFASASFSADLNWGMVFLQEQFDKADRDRPEIWRLFEDDYRHRSIIFVGISFRDPVLRRIIALARSRVPRTSCNHYLLTKREIEPSVQAKQAMFAESLRRSSIIVIFMDSQLEIMRLVQRIALVAFRPIIGFSGNIGHVNEGIDMKNAVPPGLSMTAGDIASVCGTLGEELARKKFRVTSGCAPFVGIPPVERAFKIDASLARFYLRWREDKDTTYRRTAPAVVVSGKDYESMRARFIPELSALVAIAGIPHKEDEKSGTLIEIEMALAASIPVVLIPTAGGEVQKHYEALRGAMDRAYQDSQFHKIIGVLNDQVRSVPADRLREYARNELPDRIESMLAAHMGSTAPVHRSESALNW